MTRPSTAALACAVASALLKPRAGYRYEIEASYRNDIYNVALREVPPKGAPRELQLVDFAACPLK